MSLTFDELESYLTKIFTGVEYTTINDKIITFKHPNNLIKQKARLMYEQSFEKAKQQGLLPAIELEDLIEKRNLIPKEEIAKALHGNNREDYLFGLKQEYQCYLFYQKQIVACDKQIDKFIKGELRKHPDKKKLKKTEKPHKRQNKNAPAIFQLYPICYYQAKQSQEKLVRLLCCLVELSSLVYPFH